MIHAEISMYPIGTNSTSTSFYIAKSVEAIQDIEGLRYEITAMGTLLEAADIDTINDAVKKMCQLVHNLGVNRLGITLKIDSRLDKQTRLEDTQDAIKKHMRSKTS